MIKKLFFVVSLLCFFVASGHAENLAVAQLAKNLHFASSWTLEEAGQENNLLENESLILAYNGSPDYPLGSGYHVGESKTFARILVSAECGYSLPGGYDYATHPIEEASSGDILQRSVPEPHTMVVVSTNKEEIQVVHCNWSGYHRVTRATFPKKWLIAEGFQVFKTGIDQVDNPYEPLREQFTVSSEEMGTEALGTWRIVITGDVPYHRISQGTIVSHSGPGGKIVVNETRTVSNTFSCEAGVEIEVISAKVGFSVTASFSRSLAYWRDVTPGKYGYVDLYYKYMLKKFDVYYDPYFGSEYKAGSGKAYKWQAVEFQYRETSN